VTELLEWRDHDSNSEITYTGFGPYMVEKMSEDNFRVWLPDDTKNARIMVGGFASRKDARAACQSSVDGRRGVSRAVSGDAVALEAVLGREEASVEYWWARAKDAEHRLSQMPVVADPLEWRTEPSGLAVATLQLGEHSLIELAKSADGRTGIQLTIHASREDGARWDDMSAALTPIEAAQLAQAISPATSAAAEMLAALKMAKLWTDPEWVAWEHICKAIDRAEGRQP
jgi:hypothetical protein